MCIKRQTYSKSYYTVHYHFGTDMVHISYQITEFMDIGAAETI